MSDTASRLRANPSLAQLKRQAKELHSAFAEGVLEVQTRVARHWRPRRNEPFALHDALFVLAREHGFDSWAKLKAEVDRRIAPRWFRAAKTGDLDMIRCLCEADSTLAARRVADFDEHQALHFAAREGHLEVCKFLLDHGADPTIGVYPNRDTTRAIDFARMRGHAAICDVFETYLHERGRAPVPESTIFAVLKQEGTAAVVAIIERENGLVAATDADGRVILDHAASLGDLGLIDFLLDHGADPGRAGPDGLRPLHFALKGLHGTVHVGKKLGGSLLAAERLVSRGAPLDVWCAAGLGKADYVRLALEEDGAAANQPIVQPEQGAPFWPHSMEFPLSCAALYGQNAICKLLLDHGADPDAAFYGACQGEIGRTFGFPIWAAVNQGNYELVEALLHAGATPDVQLFGISSALYFAYERKDERMIALLRSYGGEMPIWGYLDFELIPEAFARASRNSDEARQLAGWFLGGDRLEEFGRAEELVPPAQRDWSGSFFGLLGFKNSRFQDYEKRYRTLEYLLPRLPDINWRGNEGMTALHVIADPNNGSWMTAEVRNHLTGLLLDHGANPNLRENDYCSTPLGWAARSGYIELVEFLLRRGVPASLPDDPEWATPLAWARRVGHSHVVAILESATGMG